MSEREGSAGQPHLRPVVFALLLALNEGDLHGYAIMQRVNDGLGRRAIVGPGTLYRNLKEVKDAGWIAHVDGPVDEDARRQYYTLTPDGRRVAAQEAARMADLVEVARSGGLLPRGGTAS